MQVPPPTGSNLSHEPSGPDGAEESSPGAQGTDLTLHEVSRLEDLLRQRTRERRDLAEELARRTALLRDAIVRFSDLPASGTEPAEQVPANSLEGLVHFTAQRDAAVARALDAEASRAEATFRLDEALGHLRASQQNADQQAALQGTARGLRLRLMECEEARAVAEARLLLAEGDLEDANSRVTQTQRELGEAGENFELELLRCRSLAAADAELLGTTQLALRTLQGLRAGMSARLGESEQALAHTSAKASRAEHGLRDALDKLVVARVELAEQQVENHTNQTRIVDLEHDLAAAEQAVAEREARAHGAEAVVQRLAMLRRALTDARSPLAEFLAQVAGRLPDMPAGTGATAAAESRADTTVPGLAIDFDALEGLEQKARTSDARVQELEAMLAGRMSRDAGLSSLKGELIDVRASATRLSDDLAKERSRRRKLGATVRALEAANQSGESVGPWIEELLELLSEGASIPPPMR